MSPILGIFASSITPSLNASSYESIATVTVGAGGASTVTLSSIPSTYKHLQIRAIVQQTRATYGRGGFDLQFNSDSGANYSYHNLAGDGGGSIGSGGTANATTIQAGYSSTTTATNIFGAGIFDILDYANTSKYKTMRHLVGVDHNGTIAGDGGQIGLYSGNWRSTSAISSITFIAGYSPFTQYTQFALYGIK